MSQTEKIIVDRAPKMAFDAKNRIVSMDLGEMKVSFAIEDFWSFSETVAEYALMTSLVVPLNKGRPEHAE
jgi:hypothetical protein